MKRSAWCGELRAADEGRTVTLCGWVDGSRDHGGLLFVDLRDRTGVVQLVADPRRAPALWEAMKEWRGEWCVGVHGRVRRRAPGNENPRLATGEIEVEPSAAQVFSRSRPLPFPLEAGDVDETLRLRYRYLDLRRPRLQQYLAIRHRIAQAVRAYLDAAGFLEVETPTLTRSTPEGARDYLVPARTAPGHFYALPQSPQLFKQLLMVAGLDRYFQLARCWRDEDLRADRQPEFTQVDIEMSFVDAAAVMEVGEGVLLQAAAAAGVDLPRPFPRLTYAEAMARYGSDKPDLRAPLAIREVSSAFAQTAFRGFAAPLAAGGVVRALTLPGGAVISRRELDSLTEQARSWGAGGLAWLLVGGEGEVEVDGLAVRSPVAKFLTPAERQALLGTAEPDGASGRAREGDAVLVVAGPAEVAAAVLGRLRLWAMDRLALRDPARPWCPVWVTDFPLLEWNVEEGRWQAVHHPFTAPHSEDVPLLSTDPGRVRAQAYDIVLNGTEVGGGSIRNHQADVQAAVFAALRLRPEEVEEKFGFLLEALSFGAPPHGGIAFGFDRLIMLLAGAETIRDVIAFPKTGRGVDPLTGAPAPVTARQLRELHLRTETPLPAPRASAAGAGAQGPGA